MDKSEDRGDEFVPDDEVEAKKSADGSEESTETPEPEAKTPEADDKAPKTEESEEGSKPPKEGWIPRFRYNSAAQRAREAEERAQRLEEELAQLRSGGAANNQSAEETPDYEALIAEAETKFAAAVKDGEPDAATAAMREVRRLEREQYQRELHTTSASSSKEVVESVRFESLMDDLLGEYESINPDSEKYDRALAERVVELHEAYMATGRYGLSDAMLKAMEVVFPTDHVEKAAEQGPAKKTTDVERNARAAAAQPPDSSGVGVDSDRAGMTQLPDASKLTEEEFERLPEEQRRRMRGDYG